MVKCNTCEQEYTVIDGTDDQGYGCAATVYMHEGETYMIGHYGSYLHDMRLYRLEPSLSYEFGIICDSCASSLVSAGTAKLIKDGVW